MTLYCRLSNKIKTAQISEQLNISLSTVKLKNKESLNVLAVTKQAIGKQFSNIPSQIHYIKNAAQRLDGIFNLYNHSY